MAVQSAFQTLQTDFNNAVSVGSRPTHASTGQLQDDLLAIHRGKLSGTAATTAIQSDEAVILSSLGLTTDQVSQIQSDLQSLQAAIQLGTSTASTTTTVANGSSTTDPTATTPATGAAPSTTSGSSSTTSVSPTVSAIQTASQTLQTDLKNDLPSGAQASNASIGQVEDDLNAIGKGMLTGSQAVTTLQTDTAAVWTSMGLTSAQVSQIQSDQAAVEAAIQANSNAAPTTTSPTTSTTTSSTTSGSNSSSPTSIAGVEATMQSVQQYLVGLPGIGSMAMTIGGGKMSGGDPGLGVGGRSGIVGGPIMIMRHAPGISGSSGAGSGSGASGGHSAISGSVASGAPVMIPHGSLDISGGSGTIGGPVFVRSANGRQSAVNVSTSPVGFGVGGGGFGTMKGGWR